MSSAHAPITYRTEAAPDEDGNMIPDREPRYGLRRESPRRCGSRWPPGGRVRMRVAVPRAAH